MIYKHMIIACTIFAKYDGEDEYLGGADHDVVFFSANKSISEEDQTILADINVEWSEEYNCWIGWM